MLTSALRDLKLIPAPTRASLSCCASCWRVVMLSVRRLRVWTSLSENLKGRWRIGDVFPINKWTEAYHAHRYAIRLYAFSEYCNDVAIAGKKALAEVTKISDPDFY